MLQAMLKAALRVLKLSRDKTTHRNSAQYVLLLHWLAEKETQTNKPKRIGRIGIYTDPLYCDLRKWMKSYKTAC